MMGCQLVAILRFLALSVSGRLFSIATAANTANGSYEANPSECAVARNPRLHDLRARAAARPPPDSRGIRKRAGSDHRPGAGRASACVRRSVERCKRCPPAHVARPRRCDLLRRHESCACADGLLLPRARRKWRLATTARVRRTLAPGSVGTDALGPTHLADRPICTALWTRRSMRSNIDRYAPAMERLQPENHSVASSVTAQHCVVQAQSVVRSRRVADTA
jgi:hypothetical protein